MRRPLISEHGHLRNVIVVLLLVLLVLPVLILVGHGVEGPVTVEGWSKGGV